MSAPKTKKTAKRSAYSGKRVLVMGLGLHGGGVATVKWLLRRNAIVTATDKRSKEVLGPSIAALKGLPVNFVLGEHRDEDFRDNDLIVVNPGVPRESPYLAIAKKAKRRLINDAAIFFGSIKNPAIGVTGTRGKSTTTAWIAQLLKKRYPKVRTSGNTPENAFLKEYDRVEGTSIPVVAELSSWQLEFLAGVEHAPHIAIITNLFPDHLNRYTGMNDYANAKANIFSAQTAKDFLILNRDNEWFSFFARKKHKSKLLCVSQHSLPATYDGIFIQGGYAVLRMKGRARHLFSIERFAATYGPHNLSNMLAAVLAIHLLDPKIIITERDILRLKAPRMRQEIVGTKGDITIVNDSCATSPDGVIAAIERFRTQGDIVLITGGTDKELEFTDLAKVIAKHVPPDHLVFLEGSATTKLLTALAKHPPLSRRGLDTKVRKNLDSCVNEALRIAKRSKGKVTILFSPGAASFEKFLHEFDRGEQFNALVK